MVILFNTIILLLSFYVMAMVCEHYFVDSLDSIAKKWKMNSDMAGATLMAIGSSAPELFVSLFALFKVGNESIGAGTIVGSALFNILVIIGAAAIVRRSVLAWQPVFRDLVFYAISIILLIFSFKDGIITIYEMIIFLAVYVIYIYAVINWKKYLPYKDEVKDEIEKFEEGLKREEKKKNIISHLLSFIDKLLDKIFPQTKHYWIIFLMSILIIMGLSWVLVESAVAISIAIGVPSVIIGLTILAIGTSVPDFISSVVVSKQGRGGMAVSNALGSNIFNILIGLGLPWFLLSIFSKKIILVETGNLNTSIVLLFVTIIATFLIFIINKWRIGRFSGMALIGIYLVYLVWAILQAI